MDNYTFEQLWKDLNEGYQIYYTYMDRTYLLSKLKSNCYSRELIEEKSNGPHPKTQIITLKSVKELFPFMQNIEYKINAN